MEVNRQIEGSFLRERGYVRKRCEKCGEFFWTLHPEQEVCGESPCVPYSFIKRQITKRPFSLKEIRELFVRFFERKGHEHVPHYPVVARWRDDLLFTHASIIDFQPYVTEGTIPPPANPLVIIQPCLRFVDIDHVGPTFGRHLTMFEMAAHHAFNYPDKRVYWEYETVAYHHEFLTEELGIKEDEITYKEGFWSGGGNAGPDVEAIVGGLELSTLVFMQYRTLDGKLEETPVKTVDTGYGVERFAWLSQGSITAFHAIYGEAFEDFRRQLNVPLDEDLFASYAKISALASQKDLRSCLEIAGISEEDFDRFLKPFIDFLALLDHTKAVCFILSEGVVPSNVKEGYLARLLIRRSYRLLSSLGGTSLHDMVARQIRLWSPYYPILREMEDEILELLDAELKKYAKTLEKGLSMVARFCEKLKARGMTEFPKEKLVEFYDSHGITPEQVAEEAGKRGVKVEIPVDFYALVCSRHIPSRKAEEPIPKELKLLSETLPETRLLFYEDPYKKEFEAKVLAVEGDWIVLDKTLFYPEGGGQPADKGFIEFDGRRSEVVDVQKIGPVVFHRVKGPLPSRGQSVRGLIDWERRHALMRSHTATHILIGAARRVLGEHAWQWGAQKGVEESRLDISHYERLSFDKLAEIERLANQVIRENREVKTYWMPRGEAERRYGMRIYQGGAVPGKDLRIVNIEGWDVEACCGTHCSRTGEVGFIKIVRRERLQDGVERLVFKTGSYALEEIQSMDKTLHELSELLGVPREKLVQKIASLVEEHKKLSKQFSSLVEELAKCRAKDLLSKLADVGPVRVVCDEVKEFDEYPLFLAKEVVKKEPSAVVVLFSRDKRAKLLVKVGDAAIEKGVHAGKLASMIAKSFGGGGGGEPDLGKGGGMSLEKIEEAKKKVFEVVRSMVKTDRA